MRGISDSTNIHTVVHEVDAIVLDDGEDISYRPPQFAIVVIIDFFPYRVGIQDIEPQRGVEVHLQFHTIRWRQVWRQLAVGNALCYFYLGNMYNFWWMRRC